MGLERCMRLWNETWVLKHFIDEQALQSDPLSIPFIPKLYPHQEVRVTVIYKLFEPNSTPNTPKLYPPIPPNS